MAAPRRRLPVYIHLKRPFMPVSFNLALSRQPSLRGRARM